MGETGQTRQPPPIVRRVVGALGVLVAAYLLVCAAVALFQRSLVFFPSVIGEAEALRAAGQVAVEPWRDPSGALVGWRRPSPDARARLLVFHGNAGMALDRAFYADAFGGAFDVWILEYPGYGSRAGPPGRGAFIEAGLAAVEALLASDGRPLYLLGESIGSGTASAIAGQRAWAIAGVVLVTPFARLADVAARVFPWLPVRWLLRHDFDNTRALEAYAGPVVVVVAEHDEVVGADQGHQLFTSYAGPKRLIVLAGATHNSFPAGPSASWVSEVRALASRGADALNAPGAGSP